MTPRQGERLFGKDYAVVLMDIAEQDLESAAQLVTSRAGRPENAVFLCQQAMEKALKASLVGHATPVPMVHDLAVLVAKMPPTLNPPYGYELSRYNDYAGILRYERGHTRLTFEDLDAALAVAREVVAWARASLGDE